MVSGSFTLNSTWTANFEGELINASGHLHDGGQHVQVLVEGKPSCKSVATYGGDPAYIQKPSMGGHSHGHGGAMKHISSMTICSGDSLHQRSVRLGQKWEIQGYYDYKKDGGMMHSDGKQDHVMAISIQYVEVKRRT
jgi:hypothetical protein